MNDPLLYAFGPALFELGWGFYAGARNALYVYRMPSVPDHCFSSGTHNHRSYEFIVPEAPMPYLRRENSNYFGYPERVYPVPPNIPHGVSKEMWGASYLEIAVDEGYMERTSREMGLSLPAFNGSFKFTPVMRGYAESILAYGDHSQYNNERRTTMLAYLLTSELILAGQSLLKEEISEIGWSRGVYAAADYLETHFGEDRIYAKDLAKMCGMPLRTFYERFRQTFGDTPGGFLASVRFSNALMLLSDSTLSLTEIAKRLGFASEPSFSNFFKKKQGESPNEYRLRLSNMSRFHD